MKKPDTPYISKSKGTPIFENEENELYSYRKDETKVPIHLKVTLTIKEAAEYSKFSHARAPLFHSLFLIVAEKRISFNTGIIFFLLQILPLRHTGRDAGDFSAPPASRKYRKTEEF